MLIRYILSYLFLITYSYSDIASQCLSLEKRYFLKELTKINCQITKYTEDDDKLHCIENKKSYVKGIQEIDLLFQNIIKEVQSDDDYSLNIEKGGDICYSLGSRVSDISRGNYDWKQKEQLLDEVSREIKHKHTTKLLNSLVTYPRKVPTQCVDELKSFLSKKLKGSSFLHIVKASYYVCLDRYSSMKKIEPKVKEINKPDNNLGKVVSPTPSNTYGLRDTSQKNEIDTYEDNMINQDYDGKTYFYSDSNLEEYKNIVRDTCSKIEEYYTQPCKSMECIDTQVDRYEKNILEIITQYNYINNVDIYDYSSCKKLVQRLNSLKDLPRHEGNQYKNSVKNIKIRFRDGYRKFLSEPFSSPLRCYKVDLFSLTKNNNPEVPTNMGCYVKTIEEFTVGKCDNITKNEFELLKNIPDYRDITIKGKVQCE